MMKKVFAILCAVLVMACAVVPCFASNWYEETPEYSGNFIGTSTEFPFLSVQMQVREVVEKAYQLGLFGGAKPFAVMYYFPANSTSFRVMVGVPNHNIGAIYSADGLPKAGAYSSGALSPSANAQIVCQYNYAQASWAMWQLESNGDWTPTKLYTASSTSYQAMSSTNPGGTSANWKYVAYWGTQNNPTVWGNTGLFGDAYKTGWNETSTPQNATLAAIIAKYNRALQGIVEDVPDPEPSRPVYNYELNIPAIFDGMFNGVRSILSGFDLNIFGISIVGMLVAFIVIAVVAFIVRKLWK